MTARFFKKIAIAAIALAAATGTVRADGALAVATDGSATGYAYGFATPAEARRAALSTCGDRCAVVAEFRATCAAHALSIAPPQAGASALGATPAAARDAAVAACAKAHGAACRAVVWACDR